MNIRHCPGCAQLVHFEADNPVQHPWNCGRTTDFSRIKSAEQRLSLWLLSRVEFGFERLFLLWPRTARAGKVALVLAMPVAVFMLLVCNSFDVRIVHDLTASFLAP